MLLGPGKQRVELVGGKEVGGAVSPCNTSSGILVKNSLSLSSSVFSNTSVVLRNSAIERQKNSLAQ